MFDDHSANTPGQVPGNLPLGEPQDIFEATEPAAPLAPPPSEMMTPSTQILSAPSSALTAGILTPKVSTPASSILPPSPGVVMEENAIKEPKLSRGIMMTIMTLVILFVLIGSGWFVYHIFTKQPSDIAVIPVETLPVGTPTTTNSDELLAIATPPVETVPTSSDAVDHEIIVGESPDSDGDGLKDEREKELGTDFADWDTDGDDLSDGEEVLIWHTNPKNADTDADTYKDGAEIKAGYNPSGPGRLAEINSSAATTSPTSNTNVNIAVTSSPSLVSTSTPSVTTTSPEISSSDIEL